MKVAKRDGSTQLFQIAKIQQALDKAFAAGAGASATTESYNTVLVNQIYNDVTQLYGSDADSAVVPISSIQDIIENVLMQYCKFATAKAYILYRHQRDAERNAATAVKKLTNNTDIVTPWGPIGYITYKRTYARGLAPASGGDAAAAPTEEFKDTVGRVLQACQTQLNIGFTNDELAKAYEYLMKLKFSVAGRFLWQLGTTTVDKLGLASLQNCAFVKIDSPVRPFTWTFDMLMLGSGVGFNIQKKNVDKIPPVFDGDIDIVRLDTKDADFIVPDSREGWVSLLEKVLEAFFIKGKGFSYSTILVRNAGTAIKGFGGVASGPEDLCQGIKDIGLLLRSRRGRQLKPIDCLDIIDIIASVVVAGNIRRASLLSVGDCDDVEYLRAKRWDLGGIPNWRAMSNNSVICNDTSLLPDEFWEGYRGNGEPYGLINIDLARSVGRIKDGDKYPDLEVEGFNPCAEQSLANHETCCLAELFLPNIKSWQELTEVASYAYRICKHSLMLPCHHEETEEIVRRNMRMGIGITGYMQATEEQQGWLSDLYEWLRAFDVQYSMKNKITPSIKLTTVKPSGTLSLLAGVTPGAHPGIYGWYIRRVRIATNNPLVELVKAHGYHVEYQRKFDGTDDRKTMVASFPCKYPAHTRLAKDMTAIDQLETVKKLQNEWSDNAVSVTIYYRKEELDAIKEWLGRNYKNNIKTCSFLLHNDHGFAQAPYEEISEEEYVEMSARVVPISMGSGGGGVIAPEDDYSMECAGGACPMK